jgi:hypothetical protein
MAVFLLSGCIREVVYTSDDKYTPFPEAQILDARFYYQLNGADVSGDGAGMISKNEDGTYKVKMKRRSPSTSPTVMFIMSAQGPFEFSDFYKISCTFPDDPAINKPYRVYACASRQQDGNQDADYPTAVELLGDAVFRNGVAIGTFDMTNEGINYLNPDPFGRSYITVFLYLYFQNVGDPDEYYEFTLDYVGGAKAKTPESVVTKAAIYRAGDAGHKFEAIVESLEEVDPVLGPMIKKYIIANFNHRFDSRTITPAVPAVNTGGLCLDMEIPDSEGKEIQFEIQNVGLFQTAAYPAPDNSNLITADMIKNAQITGLTESDFVITEKEVIPRTSPPSFSYTIKTKVVRYADMTGIKMVIPGTETFSDTRRFTFTLNIPDKFITNEE